MRQYKVGCLIDNTGIVKLFTGCPRYLVLQTRPSLAVLFALYNFCTPMCAILAVTTRTLLEIAGDYWRQF